MPIMIDTSVWIDFFRGYTTPQVARLKALLGEEDLLIGDLILAEILQGIRDDRDVLRVEAAFAPYSVIPLVGEAIARQGARYYRRLRKQGITVRKTIDCLIATWCITHRVCRCSPDLVDR
ncbi:MAG: type II toxin-antitoxin system VapC family toxin [Anaerolineae bacterium]